MKRKRNRPVVDVDEDVYSLALDRVEHTLKLVDNYFVSFSGGKDSTAVLNVVATVAAKLDRLPVRCVFFDEEAIPVQTADYVRRVSQRPDCTVEWYCLPVQHRNACSRNTPYWYPWALEVKDKWVRELPPEALTTLDGFPINPPEARLSIPNTNGLFAPSHLGNVAMFMGIRAQESITRRRAVTRKVNDNYIVWYDGTTSRGNLLKSYPIFDWRTEDVWTAPAIHQWDYNEAYDVMEMAGLPHSLQRCSPAFGEEPLQKLWTYATCFPEVWSKMTDRVEGAASAARYALTELYGYKQRPEKPAGLPWEDWIAHHIRQWPEDKRHLVAERCRQEIEKHFKKTNDPLVVKAPHPISGVSWDFILMIAMRGDLKTRKSPLARLVGMDDIGKFWDRYYQEKAELISAGELQ